MLDFKKQINDYIAWAVVSGLAILSFGLTFYYLDVVNNDIDKISQNISKGSLNNSVDKKINNSENSSERVARIVRPYIEKFKAVTKDQILPKEGEKGRDNIGVYNIVDGIKMYDLSVGKNIEVSWNQAEYLKQDEKIKFLTDINPGCAVSSELGDYDDYSYSYYAYNFLKNIAKVGTIQSPEIFKGDKVFYFSFTNNEPFSGAKDVLGFFDDKTKQFIYFYNNSYDSGCYNESSKSDLEECGLELRKCSMRLLDSDNIESINFFDARIVKNFPELESKEKVEIPNADSYLSRITGGIYPNVMTEKIDGLLFDNVYKAGKNDNYENKNIGGYFILSPLGKQVFYDYIPYFLKEEISKNETSVKVYIGNIVFNSAEAKKLGNKFVFGYPQYGGCGGTLHNNLGSEIVNRIFSSEELSVVGKTEKGDKIYELKNKAEDTFYQDNFQLMYNLKENFLKYKESIGDVVTNSEQNISSLSKEDFFNPNKNSDYKTYLDSVPFIFWKDEFGNWRVYEREYYWQQKNSMTLAECGKPVIYLYPQKDTSVNVRVAPNGGLTIVDPFYPTGGWNVLATPESVLTNTDGKTYPYLFWEGKAYDMNVPQQGFVLKREEVEKKMTALLVKLGLNQKETKDFLEFWQPKLEEKDFAFVTFLPQNEFDALAPLTVSPQPDKVIRVFMIYEPLDNFVKVAPLKIETPVRTGFTVVEWGGRLLK
ncbi:MAG TPA: hypothetical protein P5230_04135 [Candidatus Magasanikbacteria bacterium]|nr:hypothetical protein [Candidatus Magasanikbacteria bacterium]